MTYVVTGQLPPQALSPNARVHWAVKQRATKAYRWAWFAAFREARIPPMGSVAVSLEFYTAMPLLRGVYRPHDADNALASCKSLLDALQDAGVITTDGRMHMRVLEPRIYGTKKEHGGRSCVVCTLEALAAVEGE